VSNPPVFTVFTPTYNRAHTLPRLYASLQRQTFRDFEWLIVDDGSTDNTRDVVAAWQECTSTNFPIRYFWQENAHKKAAFDRGVSEAKGELFYTFDSDDEALPETLQVLNKRWHDIPEAERHGFSGVTGLCITANGDTIGTRFPLDILDSDSQEIVHRYKIKGEKSGFHRTDVLRQFRFPMNVQGHVPEGIVWSAIATRFKTRFVNDPLRIVHFEPNSIGRSPFSAGLHADGLSLWKREILCNELRWFFYNPFWFLKTAANYSRFHLHLHKTEPGKRWPLKGIAPRLLVAMMCPIGALRFWLDRWKTGRD
jgi:glycosyltransferase involved in cell wall biosynthesis